MEDFLSRFSDSLIFEHTKTFFSNEGSEDDNNSILKNPKPNVSTNEKPTFRRRLLFHIFRSIHSITVSYIYPDYVTLRDSIINHHLSFKTQTRNLHTFLLQVPRNRGENHHDLDVFIEQYRKYYGDIEKELECFETQLGILEKKLKLDLKLIDLKLMDTRERARLVSVLEPINIYRRQHRRKMIALLAEKTAYEFRFLGLKGLISNDFGTFEFPYYARILHGYHWRKATTPLQFRRLNLRNYSKMLRFRELLRDSK